MKYLILLAAIVLFASCEKESFDEVHQQTKKSSKYRDQKSLNEYKLSRKLSNNRFVCTDTGCDCAKAALGLDRETLPYVNIESATENPNEYIITYKNTDQLPDTIIIE